MGKTGGRVATACGGIALTAMLLAGFPASAAQGYVQHKLTIISEPGKTNGSYVSYYQGDKKQVLSALNWVDGGRSGQAVRLDGVSEYLQLGYYPLQTGQLTFSGWINWLGPPAGKDEDRYGQKLFTLTGAVGEGEKTWIAFSPHMRNAEKADADGRILDGLYFGFQKSGTMLIDRFNPAQPGKENYALPVNEWHHVAMVNTRDYMRVYIDGELWFEDSLLMGIIELRANRFYIGRGLTGEPYLNALLDDVALYDMALSANQIKLLAAGADPLAEGATLPSRTEQLPTGPVLKPAEPGGATQPAGDGTVFGLPLWTVIVIGVIVAAVVILSIVLSVTQGNKPKGGNADGGQSQGRR